MARKYAPNRIREVRKARGMSQEELGASMSVELTGSTIAKLERGNQALSLDYLTEIARILRADVLDLLPGDGPTTRWIPVVGMVAAGSWDEAIQVTDKFIPLPPHIEAKNPIALEIEGDSMDLVVPAGGDSSFAIVDRDQIELLPGRYYVVVTEDGTRATFKQFSADPLCLKPCSSNPSHKPIPLGAEPFRVLGRVVSFMQSL